MSAGYFQDYSTARTSIMHIDGYQDWIGIPTLVCSTLSAFATGTVLMMWIVSHNDDKWSFRYMLIMNLTIAEFINSWNNTISGFTVVSSRDWLTANGACQLNGWIGQISVQAADFSVLAIAVTTLLTVNFNKWVINSTRDQQLLVCAAVWIVPAITGTAALAADEIGPVTGNWCWIDKDPPYLRYILGHLWRVVIFAIVIACYIGVFVLVHRRLKQRDRIPSLSRTYSFGMYAESEVDVNAAMANNELIRGKLTTPTTVREAVTRAGHSSRNRETGLEDEQEIKVAAQTRLGVKPRIRIMMSSKLDHDTKHWLMLSLFPLVYILVWIPGMLNRAVELGGGSSQTLTALQATTQLTGLMDAVVYGFREHRLAHRRRRVARARKLQAKEMDLDI